MENKMEEINENILREIYDVEGEHWFTIKAGNGQIYVPDSISLHLNDLANCWNDTSLTGIDVDGGVISYDHHSGNVVGQVNLPANFGDDRFNPIGNLAKYSNIVEQLCDAGILTRNGDAGFILRPHEVDGLDMIGSGVYEPHDGACYLAFPSPNDGGGVGRISIHRDARKTIEMYSKIEALLRE